MAQRQRQRGSRRTPAHARHKDNEGIVPVLARAVRELESAVQRGPLAPGQRVRFQVDTGPLIFPDLTNDAEQLIDCCYLAHTVYNTFTYAEFVGKQPTPLIIDGREATSIYHYSKYWQLDVTNELYSIE